MARIALAFRDEDRAIPYRVALQRWGTAEAVDCTPDSGRGMDDLDGLLLTGGTDVDPALYGQTRGERTQEPDRERDDYELGLLRDALAKGRPVFAICRGMQLMNVAFGGTLSQHIERHSLGKGGTPSHTVIVSGGSRLEDICGAAEMPVNSRHHQAVDKPGEGLIVSGAAQDGVVEAVELPGANFALGVQWHPEDMVQDERQLALFLQFALRVEAEAAQRSRALA